MRPAPPRGRDELAELAQRDWAHTDPAPVEPRAMAFDPIALLIRVLLVGGLIWQAALLIWLSTQL